MYILYGPGGHIYWALGPIKDSDGDGSSLRTCQLRVTVTGCLRVQDDCQ